MAKSVPSPVPSRNRSYTPRELDLMMVASSALLGGRAPALSADDLVEAGVLLEELPEPEDDGPHSNGCCCWKCDDSLLLETEGHDEDEILDMARDLAQDGAGIRWCS